MDDVLTLQTWPGFLMQQNFTRKRLFILGSVVFSGTDGSAILTPGGRSG